MQYHNMIFMDLGEQLVKFDNTDGDGAQGYGYNGTLSWEETWTTPYTMTSTVNAGTWTPGAFNDPAVLYQSQTAGMLTLAFFIVLPLMQTISEQNPDDLIVQSIDVAVPPPPPPPAEEEPEPEREPEEPPPQLAEETAPLNLDMLELALNPGLGADWMGSADFAVKLNTVVSAQSGDNVDAIFSMADLDQKPRVVYQPAPAISREVRRKAPGTVYVLFMVDERGNVIQPRVQQSTDPVFEKPALSAVKSWKFEPGKRGRKAVRFRMRVPITFPKG